MNSKNHVAQTRRLWRMGGVLSIIAIVVAWVLVSHPLVSARDELKQRMQAIDALRATEHSVMERLNVAKSEVAALRILENERLERSDPKHDETTLLRWVNQQASASDIDLRDFRPANRQTDGDYSYRTIILSAQGTYGSVCLFMDRLRDCPLMLRITSFEILPYSPDRSVFGATLSIQLATRSATTPAVSAKPGVNP